MWLRQSEQGESRAGELKEGDGPNQEDLVSQGKAFGFYFNSVEAHERL